jgi:hypothetical protein
MPTIKLLQKRDKLLAEVNIAKEQHRIITLNQGYSKDYVTTKEKMYEEFLKRNNLKDT